MKLVEVKATERHVVTKAWIFIVEGDWISPNIEKHVKYLLPKVIGLMFKNNRPIENIKEVLEVYAYYSILAKAGLPNSPILIPIEK